MTVKMPGNAAYLAKNLIDHLPGAWILLKLEKPQTFIVFHVNNEAQILLSPDIKEIAGRNFNQVFTPLNGYSEIKLDDFSKKRIISICNAKGVGSELQAQLAILPLNGEEVYGVLLNEDTQINELEQRAKKAEQEMKVILSNTHFGIKQMNPELDIINANKTACEAMNSEPDALIGTKCYTHVGNSEPCPNCPVLLSMESKSPQEHIQAPGNGHSYLIRSIPVLNDSNELTSIMEFFEDITDIQEKENRLIESENKFRNLFEYSNDSIFLLKDFEIKDCNITALKIFGFTDKELVIGNNMEILSDKLKQPGDINTYFSSPKPEKSKAFDWNFTRYDGTALYGHVLISELLIKGECLLQVIIRDITIRKQLEEQLIKAKEKAEESDRLKTAFLANMSHDIRTPLNAIMGFSSLLLRKGKLDEMSRRYMSLIKNSGNQLLRLINDIMAISFLETGQQKLHSKQFCLNTLLHDLYNTFYIQLSENIELHLETGFDDENSRIMSDEAKIEQVLANLIQNAIKYTDRGTITFGYSRVNGSIEFYVKDTGIGIPEQMHEKIFERFRQVDNTSGTDGGSGLGLAICQGLTEFMGGSIRVESIPSEGSTFRFTVPYNPVLENNLS